MFEHQLVSETLPSLQERGWGPSINAPEPMLRLLERKTGFGQFRVDLPGTVQWSPEAARLHGPDHPLAGSLEEAVLAYVAADRTRIVDTIRAAIQTRKGFRFTARTEIGGRIRVLEVIGDVRLDGDVVTGLFGFSRDVSARVESEALALSRARLIRRLVEDMPVPIVVLDRALRVVGCSSDWARAHGLPDRAAALNRPLGRLVEVTREITAAIIEGLNGRTTHVGLWFHSGEAPRQVRRSCAVIPWQCGADEPSGVIMVIGGGEPSFASAQIADQALGRTAHSLLKTLETLSRPATVP
ncbi:MAG TPA: hypothetical protein VHB19_16330 [Devosia sp.]|nr:hypothetical protein [Devosia sp.]